MSMKPWCSGSQARWLHLLGDPLFPCLCPHSARTPWAPPYSSNTPSTPLTQSIELAVASPRNPLPPVTAGLTPTSLLPLLKCHHFGEACATMAHPTPAPSFCFISQALVTT